MKKIILVYFFIYAFVAIDAQNEKPILYLSLSGLSKGSKQSIDYIKGHQIFEISYIVYGYEDKNIPNDYVSGSFLRLSSKPHVFIKGGSVSYGYSYKFDKIVRLNSKIGISYNLIENPENYQSKIGGSDFLGSKSNYSYDKIKSKNVGIIINPEVQFLISRVNALSFGLDMNVMKEHTRLLFEFSLEFGRLRDKKQKI